MPDTSPNVPVPGAPTSREASAQAAAADSAPESTAAVRTAITVPESVSMVALLMATYLVMSLTISAVANTANRMLEFPTR